MPSGGSGSNPRKSRCHSSQCVCFSQPVQGNVWTLFLCTAIFSLLLSVIRFIFNFAEIYGMSVVDTLMLGICGTINSRICHQVIF